MGLLVLATETFLPPIFDAMRENNSHQGFIQIGKRKVPKKCNFGGRYKIVSFSLRGGKSFLAFLDIF